MDVSAAVADYCAAWCEPDETRRHELLEGSWSRDGVYCDPMARAEGRDALFALIGGYHQQYPGAKIVQTSGVDLHNAAFRFTWSFVDGDGVTQIDGIDFGEVADDGRLARITGFFGPVPPLA